MINFCYWSSKDWGKKTRSKIMCIKCNKLYKQICTYYVILHWIIASANYHKAKLCLIINIKLPYIGAEMHWSCMFYNDQIYVIDFTLLRSAAMFWKIFKILGSKTCMAINRIQFFKLEICMYVLVLFASEVYNSILGIRIFT